MTDDKVNHICMLYLADVPVRERTAFIEKLKSADDECYDRFLNVPVKNKTTVTLFSVFLGVFGVDRFYLGDYLIGAIKLFINIIVPAIYLSIVLSLGGSATTMALMYGIMIWALVINVWWIVDIFLCRNRCNKIAVEGIKKELE